MENVEFQVRVYTLLERPTGPDLLFYHALFALAFLVPIGLSVLQTTGKYLHLV